MPRRRPTPVIEPPPEASALPPEELLRHGAVKPAEAALFSGVGVTTLEAAMSAGALPSFKVGACRLIPRRGLILWLARHYADTAAKERLVFG